MNYKLLITSAFIFCLFLSIPAQQGGTVIVDKALAVKMNRMGRRSVSQKDIIESALVNGSWQTPKSGDELVIDDTTTSTWTQIEVGENGWFEDKNLRGGYALMQIESDVEKTIILEGMAHATAYVNGAPRAGNVYQYKDKFESWEPKFNISLLPIRLQKGSNEILFKCYYGRFKALLHEPVATAQFNEVDLTLPDLRVGEKFHAFGGIVILNNSNEKLDEYVIQTDGEYFEKVISEIPIVQPISTRKVKFCFKGEAPEEKKDLSLQVSIINKSSNDVVYKTSIPIRVLTNDETYKQTFVSKIDGSVQYYAVNPSKNSDHQKPQALFLSLHGAAVEGANQANAYYGKDWGTIVSPTNRRPYGFNWEDWGRTDALEVFDIAKSKFNIDPSRVYLTGHSMGGHGTWHLGACFPDKFGAIGPSAGWISFWSYRFNDSYETKSPVVELINRSGKQSDTYALTKNYEQLGVYIIHGSEDDNVKAEQSYGMIKELEKFHKDFVFHEEMGAGHWWDKEETNGADCVDWLPLFDYFSRHAVPTKERIKHINFRTAHLGISAKNNWVTIYNQEEFLKMSVVDIKYLPGKNRFVGTTENINTLAIEVSMLNNNETISVNIDEIELKDILAPKENDNIWLKKLNGSWQVVSQPSMAEKGPHRYGTYKHAFDNKMIFVYGSIGSPEENDWSFNKAKYDAEQFWYQGNGAVEIICDKDYSNEEYPDRNIILYGNEETNEAWNKLLNDAPFSVSRNEVIIGEKNIAGDDLTCLTVYPRKDSDYASVGIVAGTGIKGMRLANRRPYLSAGFAYPDFTVFNTKILQGDDDGYLAAGFFGNDWSIENGEFVYAK